MQDLSTVVDPARNRAVARWLLLCCGLVFAMVVLGGFTRLTGSGLSMVDWRPIMGILPPLGDAQWQRVFELYQQSPEFQNVNSHMDVHAFKSIFWLEYLHRLLGRVIGIVFLRAVCIFCCQRLHRKTRVAEIPVDVCTWWHAGLARLVHGEERPGRSYRMSASTG